MKRTLYRTGRWFRRQKWGKIFLILLIIAAWIGFGYVCIDPSLWKFRGSLLFACICYSLITVPTGWLIWSRRETKLAERIIATIPLIGVWFQLMIGSDQIRLLLWIVIFYGMLCYWLYLFYLYQTTYETAMLFVIGIEALLIVMSLIKWSYSYKLEGNWFPHTFWLPALIVALILATIAGLPRVVSLFSPNHVVGTITMWVTTFVLSFVLLSFTIAHLNYALDGNAYQSATAVIADKDVGFGSRTGRGHYFELHIDGETFKLDVSESDYRSHEIGNDFAVELHQGAFGVPYYIASE